GPTSLPRRSPSCAGSSRRRVPSASTRSSSTPTSRRVSPPSPGCGCPPPARSSSPSSPTPSPPAPRSRPPARPGAARRQQNVWTSGPTGPEVHTRRRQVAPRCRPRPTARGRADGPGLGDATHRVDAARAERGDGRRAQLGLLGEQPVDRLVGGEAAVGELDERATEGRDGTGLGGTVLGGEKEVGGDEERAVLPVPSLAGERVVAEQRPHVAQPDVEDLGHLGQGVPGLPRRVVDGHPGSVLTSPDARRRPPLYACHR